MARSVASNFPHTGQRWDWSCARQAALILAVLARPLKRSAAAAICSAVLMVSTLQPALVAIHFKARQVPREEIQRARGRDHLLLEQVIVRVWYVPSAKRRTYDGPVAFALGLKT